MANPEFFKSFNPEFFKPPPEFFKPELFKEFFKPEASFKGTPQQGPIGDPSPEINQFAQLVATHVVRIMQEQAGPAAPAAG